MYTIITEDTFIPKIFLRVVLFVHQVFKFSGINNTVVSLYSHFYCVCWVDLRATGVICHRGVVTH